LICLRLLQIDHSGELLWDSIYGRTGDDEAYDLIVRENGNLVVTGYSEGTEAEKKQILFLETDRTGLELKMNYRGTSEDDEAFTIVQSNNKYMIAGYTNYRNAQSMQIVKNIIVLRWSGEGTPDVNPFVNAFPEGTNSHVQAIIPEGINDYYLACNVQEPQSNESYVSILKIDTTLFNVMWQKDYGERLVNTVSDFSLKSNMLYLCGTSTNTEERGDLWILKTSIEGENPQYFYIGDGVSYIGKGFDHTSDGGYIITGASYISEKSIISLCKLNSQGEL